MSFETIIETELKVGEAIPWDLYDHKHRLLLVQGSVIESDQQIAQLVGMGVLRKAERRFQARLKPSDKPAAAAAPKEERRSLDEIKLSIGDTFHLQGQSGNTPLRYIVKLIGYARDRSVIVSTPTQDGKVMLMRDGQSFVVRLFAGKSVYAFSTSIIKSANVPYPHLHLSWPKEIKGLVVRSSVRAPVRLIASVSNAEGQSNAAMLEDLSVGGCALTSKKPLGERGQVVNIKFKVVVNQVEQYLDIAGVIRSMEYLPGAEGSPSVQHGIQFMDVPPSDQLVLTACIYHTLFEESADG